MLGQGSHTCLSGGLCAPSSRGLFCFCGLVAKRGSRSGQAAKRPSASSHGLSLASECRFQPSVLRIVSLAVLSFVLPSSFQTSTRAPGRRGWDSMIDHPGLLGFLLEGHLLVQDLIISFLNYFSSLLTGPRPPILLPVRFIHHSVARVTYVKCDSVSFST